MKRLYDDDDVQQAVGRIGINTETVCVCFIQRVDDAVDGVAILVAVMIDQNIIHPVTAQAVHLEIGFPVHQFLRKEAGRVTEATDNVAREKATGVANA